MTVSNQSFNLARGVVRSKSTAGGTSRLIFVNHTGYNYNKFIPGSGVGGLNSSVRRHKYREATSCQTATGDQRLGQCVAY
jgi:hypothetical protein